MVFGTDNRSDHASIEAWVRSWWPFIALALGVAFIFVGQILFSP